MVFRFRSRPSVFLSRNGEAVEYLASSQLEEAEVVLVAHLLGLLIAFIGGNLTWRLVCEVWPNLSLDDLKFNQGDPS